MAPVSQLFAHAPHSMHASLSTICALASTSANTSCGHTSMHRPQPLHASRFNASVSPFLMYVILTANTPSKNLDTVRKAAMDALAKTRAIEPVTLVLKAIDAMMAHIAPVAQGKLYSPHASVPSHAISKEKWNVAGEQQVFNRARGAQFHRNSYPTAHDLSRTVVG
jgi:hypothetical protein